MAERLFETGGETPRTGVPPAEAPLATRMRPHDLDGFVGQSHLLGEASALRVAIESGEPHSAIFYGPPGTGKTTLARIIAARVEGAFEELSAVNAGRAEVREVIARADQRRASGRPTIFFLDEIHRFNKAQQDALLPAVEEGLVTLIGATTENPYFEVNSALLSRAQIYEFRPLTDEEIGDLLRRALHDGRGLPDAPPVPDEALEMLAAARAATRESPWRRSSERSRLPTRPVKGRSRSARSRTLCSARPCSTTVRATSTTTTSQPGSRRPAGPTWTPPSTTSR